MAKRTYNKDFDACAYNDGVSCENHEACWHCGFRPSVHAERVAAIREKMTEAIKHGKKV